ncbi:MAG: hypothetical protein VX265_09940, partial [Myxococcota bacterium]|nr:hypothetical protein [Myxococcota bacterium]
MVTPLVAVDLKRDRAPEDTVEAWTRFDARASGGDAESVWKIAVRAEHAVRVGRADAGGDTEAEWWVSAGESGWEGPVGPLRVRAGYLIERWGRL